MSRFFVLLVKVKRCRQRLNAIIFKEEFPLIREAQLKNLEKINKAVQSIVSNTHFMSFLSYVQVLNEEMNKGLPRGEAKGIRLQSVNELKS